MSDQPEMQPHSDVVIVEIADAVATMTINRPRKLNALNREVLDSLSVAFIALEANDDVRVIVLAGSGGNFSAGYDISNSSVVAAPDSAGAHTYLSLEAALTMQLWSLSKPTIAAVEGWCLAGGFDLALACDLIVAADTAKFGMPEIRYGSGPVTLLLPFLMGQKAANKMLFTGDTYTAADVLELGLINDVVAADELEAEVARLAERITPTPLPILKFTKLGLIRAYEAMGLRQAVQSNLDLSAILNKAYTDEGAEFFRIVEAEGLTAALKWRDSRYGTGL